MTHNRRICKNFFFNKSVERFRSVTAQACPPRRRSPRHWPSRRKRAPSRLHRILDIALGFARERPDANGGFTEAQKRASLLEWLGRSRFSSRLNIARTCKVWSRTEGRPVKHLQRGANHLAVRRALAGAGDCQAGWHQPPDGVALQRQAEEGIGRSAARQEPSPRYPASAAGEGASVVECTPREPPGESPIGPAAP